jgi:hypothetical protein
MRIWLSTCVSGVLVLICAGFAKAPLLGQNKAPVDSQVTPKVSEAEAQKEARTRLGRLANAFWNYWEEHRTFPPSALVNKEGKALLSWRVLILPYIGEAKLFRKFKLTEPWDSPHNKMLLTEMPDVFTPTWGDGIEANTTPWQVFTGPGTIFEGSKGCRLSEITDGTSNTILVVEAGRLVPWTKPEDLTYDAKKEIPPLGIMFPRTFRFAAADGAIYIGKRDFNQKVMRECIVRNDGEASSGFEDILAK